jgi:AcrR family transcriptional regulator
MSDPTEATERREQILDAALRVFSLKGFQKATNKDIADAAGGISPGLIYHYFTNKEDLFFAIIRERAKFVQLAAHPESFMDREPREMLTIFGHAYLSALTSPSTLALFQIMIGEVLRFPQLREALYRAIIGPVFDVLVRYMQRQIELGTLRPHDPMIGVRSFVGMLMAHIMLREVFRQPEASSVSHDTVVTQVVDTFLNGLAADKR